MYVGMPNLNLFLRTTSMRSLSRRSQYGTDLEPSILSVGFIGGIYLGFVSAAASRIERCLHRGLNHFDFTTAIRVLAAVTATPWSWVPPFTSIIRDDNISTMVTGINANQNTCKRHSNTYKIFSRSRHCSASLNPEYKDPRGSEHIARLPDGLRALRCDGVEYLSVNQAAGSC